jgi:Zn-dependent protease
MLRWSIPLFRVRGIQLSLHSTFPLLLAYVAWQGWRPDEDGSGGGWLGVGFNVVLVLCFFVCVVLHELGHCLTARRFGIGTRGILLSPIGGMADMEAIPRQPSREILMTLAGPAVNFVIALMLWLFVRHLPDETPLYSVGGLLYELCGWNFAMGCFNLLPAFPMDGGRILRAVLATRLPYARATFWAATAGKVLAMVGIAVAIWAGAPMVAVLFSFIFFAGEAEYRLVCRREQEAEHWRQWQLRQIVLADGLRTLPGQGDGNDQT